MLAKQELCCLSHTSSQFCSGYFLEIEYQKLFAWAGIETTILLISASQTAGNTVIYLPF
jgi:hypothetical protein